MDCALITQWSILCCGQLHCGGCTLWIWVGILSQKTASQLHLHTQDLDGHFNPVGCSVAGSHVDVLTLQRWHSGALW